MDVWDKEGRTTALDRILPDGYLHYFQPDKQTNDDFDIKGFKSQYPYLYQAFFEQGQVSQELLSSIFKTNWVRLDATPEKLVDESSFLNVSYPTYLRKRNPRSVNSILMFYKIWRCFGLVTDRMEKDNIKYDYIVRLRSDLIFDDGYKFDYSKIQQNIIVRDTKRADHVDDIFAVGDFLSMEVYSRLWEKLPTYWKEPKDASSIYEVSGFLLAKHLGIVQK